MTPSLADTALHTFERLFGPEFGHGKSFDLARLHAALDALGAPHKRLPPIIHVAGTNGKGSTIAFIRAIAEAAGLRVHAFTKPHLHALNERFVVAGERVGDEAFINAAERIAAAAPDLTQFEAQVAAAFLLFSETPADLALIETGMGGRDDATNVIEWPLMSVITPIALDHQDVLGATLKQIATHKAGIIKRFAPVITARQPQEVMDVLEEHAARAGVALWRAGAEWDAYASAGRFMVQTETRTLDLPLPALAGPHQIDNAGLAVAALLCSPLDIDEAAIAEGVRRAKWPGRLQALTRGALAESAIAAGAEVWVDGGHNAHAALALWRALEQRNARRPARTGYIIGMRARKDWIAFLEALPLAGGLVIATPLGAEGVDPLDIADYANVLGADAHTAPDLPQAMSAALSYGAQRIVICGSLLLAGEALRA
jgi:dihydrofolate synthase/folylpolyglutamate synthase